MPWTLWRYTLFELWRVVLICTAILVSVIAFAAAAKPLAEGALTPIGAIRFMLLAVPPMLAYALPFAAGFGASLAYHRMAQDNETVAAHSGGVSHRAVLVPAVLSGLLLAGGMVGLNEWVIPRFLHAMERMITLDVAQIMVRQIDRGQAAEIGNVMIYADRIDQIDPPEDSGIRQMFVMHRVAAIQLNDEGGVETDATARKAFVALAPNPNDSQSALCRLLFHGVVGYQVGEGLKTAENGRPDPIPIPDAFEDDPKFLSFDELLRLRNNPDEMGFVDARRIQLAEQIALLDLAALLDTELGAAGRLRLRGDGGRRFEIAADDAERHDQGVWYLSREKGPVEVRRFEPDDTGEIRVSTDSAEEAWLRIEQGGGAGGAIWDSNTGGLTLRFTLQLVNVRSENASGVSNERPQRDFPGLWLLDDPLARYAAEPSAALLSDVRRRSAEGDVPPGVAESAELLSMTIDGLHREITSKQHERMALAASTLVMVVLGAISALRHRDSLPLVVYLWSFFPALAMILLISSGQQETHGGSIATGVPLLWSGVAAGAAVALFSFLKLARH